MRRWISPLHLLRAAAAIAAPARGAVAQPKTMAPHYTRLGLDVSATETLSEQDIKAAYRRAVLACHPDIVADNEKRAAEAEFRRVSESYHVLMEEHKRRAAEAGDAKPKTTAAGQFHQRSPPPQARADAKGKRPPFLRRDADQAFADAFDGRTVDEILFSERFAKRNGRNPRPAEARKAPMPHDEMLREVMSSALRRQCEAAERRFGRDAVKGARLHVYRPPEPMPPGSHIPFVPFVGVKLPEGVTAEKIPSPAGPMTHIASEPPVSTVSSQPEPSQLDRELKNPLTRGSALQRMAAEHGMRYNDGQLYSYHRPF